VGEAKSYLPRHTMDERFRRRRRRVARARRDGR